MTEPATAAFPVTRSEAGRTWTSGIPHGILLVGLALLLTTAVALQVMPCPQPAAVTRDAPLTDYFPREVAGWHGEDRPPAETEAQVAVVKKVLNYDETLLRVYRKGDQEFSVYVSYWRPGKMPARELASHVPDVCWVAVGCTQSAADYHYQREFEGHLLAPAQYRVFDTLNGRQYVIYWHILNGRAIVYSTNGSLSQLTTLSALFRHGLDHKGEQYFIRIASRSPLDDLWNDEGFQEIMEFIAPLGPGLDAGVESLAADRCPSVLGPARSLTRNSRSQLPFEKAEG